MSGESFDDIFLFHWLDKNPVILVANLLGDFLLITAHILVVEFQLKKNLYIVCFPYIVSIFDLLSSIEWQDFFFNFAHILPEADLVNFSTN